MIMDFATIMMISFGVLVLAGIYEALLARRELYRKQALQQGEDKERRLTSNLPALGPTMANGGEPAEE
jgi:hypothetical protein